MRALVLVSEVIALGYGGTNVWDLISTVISRVIAWSTACNGSRFEQYGHIHSNGSL